MSHDEIEDINEIMSPANLGPTTIVRFLLETASKHAELDCMRYLKRGEYVGITWEEVLEVTRLFSLGFQALGLSKHGRVALMSHTRYEWRLVDYGIMFAGGTTVTIYPSLTSSQVEYIINDSQSGIIVVDNESNLKKALRAKPNCPGLKAIIMIEPVPDDARAQGVLSLDDLVARGEDIASRSQPIPPKMAKERNGLKRRIAKGRGESNLDAMLAALHKLDVEIAGATGDPFITRYLSVVEDDIATIVYTSGTTGVPKGALLTHRNMAYNSVQTAKAIPIQQHDVTLSFLPLSHVLERQVSQFLATYIGFTVAIARDTESVVENLDQVKPTFITSVPRIYEKLYNRIMADVADSEAKKKIFDHAADWGWEYQNAVQSGEDVSLVLALKNTLADKLVFGKIRDILGGRLRFMFSGGAALNPVLAKFFFAAGFKIMEGYGLTETSPVLTVNRIDSIHTGTVGKPVPDTQIKIADDGEIVCKGPQVFPGYWNKPQETADAFDAEGWYHTGDLGRFTDDGDLAITGRKKMIIVLRTGKKVSPVVVEDAITLDRHVAHVCVLGDDMKYLIGIVEPNFEYLAEWLEKNGLTKLKPDDFKVYKGMTKDEYLAVVERRRKAIEMPEVVAFYDQILRQTQANLSEFEQIKRFT
ncbi:MAG: long-chain fatty acid--CoA ligase, partial [Candidatus Lokiarchaeota archaeon]|nr:long-chain fatty acid--CoA ligase [Candidatus Lokiarchaeota archaeon]